MSSVETAGAARRLRYTAVFAALAAAILIVTILNINTGSVRIPEGRILRILLTRQGEESEVSIIWRIRMPRILLSGILAACVTAFAGPVSFVGIAVPFLVKQALGTSKPLVVIPAAFLGGAVFCMVSDLIARMAFAPTELNISTVTSVLGAPIVIYMLIRRSAR